MYKFSDISISLNQSMQGKILTKYSSKDWDQVASLGINQSKAKSIMISKLKIQVR